MLPIYAELSVGGKSCKMRSHNNVFQGAEGIIHAQGLRVVNVEASIFEIARPHMLVKCHFINHRAASRVDKNSILFIRESVCEFII